ncbi:Uncharacterized protein HSRCO_2273 [Halanaeroarchaeum sp. HSR-CO]|uniref:hypothetical protein n=1 Tax=Halanaeroarchaeum sp. HSR-CO TaxID=2866382 RepID=UPI00217D1418|nr:hypothetical protein [Halanaeroarchaeum sp. HSR-CO]UWG48542.1 Uncharacterized protein HSRCO_2273 [Halanaeroarchaeum sp. HSR-CO]
MTDVALAGRTYRFLDVATKLAGVALLVGALELGIASAPGATLALAGAVLGVSTVFVTEETR